MVNKLSGGQSSGMKSNDLIAFLIEEAQHRLINEQHGKNAELVSYAIFSPKSSSNFTVISTLLHTSDLFLFYYSSCVYLFTYLFIVLQLSHQLHSIHHFNHLLFYSLIILCTLCTFLSFFIFACEYSLHVNSLCLATSFILLPLI